MGIGAEIARAAAGEPEKAIALPKEMEPSCDGMHAAPKARAIFFQDTRLQFKGGKLLKFSSTPRMVDLDTGQVLDLARLLPDREIGSRLLGTTGISPGQDKALLVARSRSGPNSSVYVMDIGARKIRRILSGAQVTVCTWVGARAAVSQVGRKGQLGRVHLIDAGGGKSQELPVRGMIFASDRKGEALFAAADPENLDAPLDQRTFQQKSHMVVLNGVGKVIRKLLPMSVVSTMPRLSPSGRYVAFQSQPPGASGGRKTRYSVTVLRTDGSASRKLNRWAKPVAVLDDGRVVTLDSLSGPRGASLRVWDAGGKLIELAPLAYCAAYADGRLYWIAGGDTPILKSVSMPPTQ